MGIILKQTKGYKLNSNDLDNNLSYLSGTFSGPILRDGNGIGTLSIDINNRTLNDENQTIVVDWNASTLKDGNSISSVVWNTRLLEDENGTHAILWDTNNSTLRHGGSTKFDWKNLAMPTLGGNGDGYIAINNSGTLAWGIGGNQGPTGADGPQGAYGGPQGPQGPQGPDVYANRVITDANAGETFSTTDSIIFANISGSIDVYMPDVAVMQGKKMTFIRTDGGSENMLQIQGPFVQSQTHFYLSGYFYSSVTFVSDGTLWHKIAST